MSILVRARYGSGRRASWLFFENDIDSSGRQVSITEQAKASALAKARKVRARGTQVWIERPCEPATRGDR